MIGVKNMLSRHHYPNYASYQQEITKLKRELDVVRIKYSCQCMLNEDAIYEMLDGTYESICEKMYDEIYDKIYNEICNQIYNEISKHRLNEPYFTETYDYSQDGTKGIHLHKYDHDVIDQIRSNL